MAEILAKPTATTRSFAGAAPTDTAATAGIALHWLLRVGMLMEFVGHGAAGITLKEGWVKYFAVYGLDRHTALTLMPIVGTVDITLGLLGFLSPRRWALVWCAFWGIMTACLRPLAGESFWEVLDRAGNYGGPLAFLLLAGFPRSAKAWFEPIRVAPVSREVLKRVAFVLQWITVLTLIGHGAYNAIIQKKMLVDQYTRVGLTSPGFGPGLGWFEMALGVAIALKPFRALLLTACAFKLATELLYPMTGYPMYEFVERGFTYVAPLALFFLLPRLQEPPEKGPA